jgi:hypothetical protein
MAGDLLFFSLRLITVELHFFFCSGLGVWVKGELGS